MVLHHVAQRARRFVVAGARAHPFLLRDRNLHVIDVPLVHQRLEDAVREPEHEDVLYRFLAEVVIDPVDLLLIEHLGDRVVDGPGALEVAADRLLDNDAREWFGPVRSARDKARSRQLVYRRREQRRRHGQVVDPIARETALVFDDIQPRAQRRKPVLVVQRGVDEEERLCERRPRLFVDRAA
jgi:hypothetical protein